MQQSSKSTEIEPIKTAHDPQLPKVREPTVADLQVAALQERLVESEDKRREERFIWFAVAGALLVAVICMGAGVAAGVVMVLVYLALLLVLSRSWGIEAFWEALSDAKDLIGGKKGNKED